MLTGEQWFWVILTIIPFVVGLWLRMAKDLNDFKLEVARNYVQATHLKETEARLLRHIDRLCTSIDALRSELNERRERS